MTGTFAIYFLMFILHTYCFYQKFIYPRRSTTSHGQIFCSGENKVGRQREPCIFTLRTASKYLIRENRVIIVLFVIWISNVIEFPDHFKFYLKHNYDKARPDIPTNCKVYNGSRSFEVKCTPGFDGGRKQTFTVEVTITIYDLLSI